MATDNGIEAICSEINRQVEMVLSSRSFNEWLENEACSAGDLVILNNSFLFREGVKATKNVKYLCVPIGDEGVESFASVAYPGAMNSPFKRFVARKVGDLQIESLSDNVAIELQTLGSIIRALVGRIGVDEQAIVSVEKNKLFGQLRYDPQQKESATIENKILSVNRIDDVDAVWRSIEIVAKEHDIELPDKLATEFEKKLGELREEACRPVDIEDFSPGSPTILGEIAARLEQQVDEYSRALHEHLTGGRNTDAINDMLRIAYNFADGADALVSLMVGASDLKPVVFWLTVGDQFDLADKFGGLPFSLVGKAKPSIARYRAVISGARNRAFHDVFSFGQPFRVRLTGDAFRSPELRLFRGYGSRRDRALDFADRRLVELMEQFTRATDQSVPRGFWESNREVMDAMAKVARSIQQALLLLVR